MAKDSSDVLDLNERKRRRQEGLCLGRLHEILGTASDDDVDVVGRALRAVYRQQRARLMATKETDEAERWKGHLTQFVEMMEALDPADEGEEDEG